MNKKLFAMMIAAAAAFAARANTEIVDGIEWYFVISGGQATIASRAYIYNNAYDYYRIPTLTNTTSGTVRIPSSLGGCSVARIDDWAFSTCSNIREFVIPDTITSIGQTAFHGCGRSATFEFLGEPPSGVDFAFWWAGISNCPIYYKREFAKDWMVYVSNSQYFNGLIFAGFVDEHKPVVGIISAAMRADDPTIMDVVYKVSSEKPTVKVRALAFADGMRSLAKVVRATEFIEGTAANIGDAIAANVEHTLSWRVSADWNTDLSKVKFEVLAVEDDLLPLELQTIPQTASHAAMKISWNKMTDEKVYDALLWLYADGDSGLTLTNGQLKNGNTILASGTGLNSAQAAVTYVFGMMGYDVLSGDNLTYARRVTQLDLPVSGVQQYAVKVIGQ